MIEYIGDHHLEHPQFVCFINMVFNAHSASIHASLHQFTKDCANTCVILLHKFEFLVLFHFYFIMSDDICSTDWHLKLFQVLKLPQKLDSCFRFTQAPAS